MGHPWCGGCVGVLRVWSGSGFCCRHRVTLSSLAYVAVLCCAVLCCSFPPSPSPPPSSPLRPHSTCTTTCSAPAVTVNQNVVQVVEGVSAAGLPTLGSGVGQVQVQFAGLVEDVNTVLSDFSLRYGAFDPWGALAASARRSLVDVRLNVSDTGVGASAPLAATPIHLRVASAAQGVPRILVRGPTPCAHPRLRTTAKPAPVPHPPHTSCRMLPRPLASPSQISSLLCCMFVLPSPSTPPYPPYPHPPTPLSTPLFPRACPLPRPLWGSRAWSWSN